MFIVHGAWFRRNSRWLLALVLLLLIPSFIFLYTQKGNRPDSHLDLPKIGGKTVNPAEYENIRAVVMGQMVLSSGGKLPNVENLPKLIQQQTTIRLVMLKKAEELGIRITDDEVVHYLRNMSQFTNEQG